MVIECHLYIYVIGSALFFSKFRFPSVIGWSGPSGWLVKVGHASGSVALAVGGGLSLSVLASALVKEGSTLTKL